MQIIYLIILLFIGIGVFELRTIKKILKAHNSEMPHWFKNWLNDEEAKSVAKRTREYEAMRPKSRYSAGLSSEADKNP